jgi:predicted CxxxxCH...CXXCH cytochrome family protein
MRNQIEKVAVILSALLCGAALLAACSSANKQASSSFNSDTGRHIAGWSSPALHGAAAKTQADGFAACQECHADDFSGGISTVSCNSCHGGSAPHPTSWITGSYTHTTTDTGNASVCAQCHTNGANSPIAPPSPPAASGTAPGCFNNTLCHAQVGHPAGWSDPTQHGVAAKSAPTSTGGFALCETCHGSDFSGGAAQMACFTCHGGNAPHPTSWITGSYTHTTTDTGNASVCAQCHTNGANSPIAPPSPPAASGTAPGCFNNTLCHTTPTCGSCHGIPPSGTAFPDVAGGHAVHTGLGAYITCDTCHAGAGSGTALHQNGTVDVSIDPTYNAKSGAAIYNTSNVTCSNISCHGGQTTPNWQTGTINVNTQCTSCHTSGTSQYNSYYSGHHSTHVNGEGFACTVCHDTTKLAVNHFTSLNTLFTEATASATINSAINFNGTTCNPSAGGLSGCHSSHTW